VGGAKLSEPRSRGFALFGLSHLREVAVSRNYYCELHLHMVWHTKLSLPVLTPPVEAVTHHFLRGYLINTPGAFVHEVGGTENHVHVAVRVAPTLGISELIGRLKGASSHEVNQKLGHGRKLLQWQAGYGVVSFGTRDLEWVKAYVRNQKEHHARGTTQERLERVAPVEAEAEAERREPP
jgi:putative transposase